MSRLRPVLVAVAVLASGLLPAPVAQATHGSSSSAILDPDNTDQCIKSPSIVARTIVVRNQGYNQLERSDIHTIFGPSSCSGDDIWVDDNLYGATDWYGRTWCHRTTSSGSRCDIYYTQFNESFYSSDINTDTKARALGCHEFGHTGSVGHRFPSTDADDNSCMQEEIYNSWNQAFDSHDIDKINDGV